MILFKITEIKSFMSKLLTTECFDSFLLVSATIKTYNTFTIDGHIEAEFYSSEEREDSTICPYKYSIWSELRPICFSLIKGKRTPVSMKYILQLKPELTEKVIASSELELPQNVINGFVLTIRFDENGMFCTTGVSFTSFYPDKTPEQLWDKAFQSFLDKQNIAYTLA